MNKKRRLLGKTAGVLAFSMILQIVSPAVIASAEDNQAYNAPQILLPETDRDFFEEVKGDIPADDNTTNNGNAQDNYSQNDVIVDEGFIYPDISVDEGFTYPDNSVDEGFTYPDNSVDEGFTHPDNSWDSENSGENVTDNPQNSTGGGYF